MESRNPNRAEEEPLTALHCLAFKSALHLDFLSFSRFLHLNQKDNNIGKVPLLFKTMYINSCSLKIELEYINKKNPEDSPESFIICRFV